MNDLQIFENSEFGTVRTVENNGKTYFVANDIAKALGYIETAKAIRTHCKGVSEMDIPSNGGIQRMKIIPEGDIYRLVIKSQLPSAERFESWVFDEVLPSIRKHGMYAVDDLINNPDLAIKAFTALKEEKERNRALQEDNDRMRPKEVFADAVATSHTSILIGDLAKLLKQNGVDIGQKRLFIWMRDNGYLIKRKGSDWNMPTQKSMELGLFEVKESTVNNPDGSVRINKTTKVTGKGQQYFINKFLGEVA
mgnify:CR=1 FL=1